MPCVHLVWLHFPALTLFFAQQRPSSSTICWSIGLSRTRRNLCSRRSPRGRINYYHWWQSFGRGDGRIWWRIGTPSRMKRGGLCTEKLVMFHRITIAATILWLDIPFVDALNYNSIACDIEFKQLVMLLCQVIVHREKQSCFNPFSKWWYDSVKVGVLALRILLLHVFLPFPSSTIASTIDGGLECNGRYKPPASHGVMPIHICLLACCNLSLETTKLQKPETFSSFFLQKSENSAADLSSGWY